MSTVTNNHTFAPVRLTDGREWLDVSASNVLCELVVSAIADTAKLIPEWDNANPVVRIVRVVVQEAETVWTPPKAERTKRDGRCKDRYMPVLGGYVLDMTQHGKLVGTVNEHGSVTITGDRP